MRLLLLIGVLLFFSCKKEKQTDDNLKNKVTKHEVQIDTTYCDEQHNNDIKREKISLYNKSYESVVKTYSLLDKKITHVSENHVTICYHKACNIVFLQAQDSIFNLTIDAPFIDKEYRAFCERYKEKQIEGISILKPIEYLSLDSISLNGARNNFVYFTSYLKDYKSSKKYKMDIGIGYLNGKEGEYIINQLEERIN